MPIVEIKRIKYPSDLIELQEEIVKAIEKKATLIEWNNSHIIFKKRMSLQEELEMKAKALEIEYKRKVASLIKHSSKSLFFRVAEFPKTQNELSDLVFRFIDENNISYDSSKPLNCECYQRIADNYNDYDDNLYTIEVII